MSPGCSVIDTWYCGSRAHRVDAVHRLARRVRRAGRVVVAARRLDVRPDVAHEQPVAAAAEDRHRVPGLACRAPARRGSRRGTARRARPRARARCARARCGSSPTLATRLAPPLAPASRQNRPTRSEPSEWNGNATPPISLPRAVGSSTALALVGDVAEQVALRVLRPRAPEVHADAPVDRRRRAPCRSASTGTPRMQHDAARRRSARASMRRELGAEGRQRERRRG